MLRQSLFPIRFRKTYQNFNLIYSRFAKGHIRISKFNFLDKIGKQNITKIQGKLKKLEKTEKRAVSGEVQSRYCPVICKKNRIFRGNRRKLKIQENLMGSNENSRKSGEKVQENH